MVQRRTRLPKALLTLLVIITVTLTGTTAATAATIKPVPVLKTTATMLAAVVIAVPPTQMFDPVTGVKDNQTNAMWALLNGWVADQAGNSPDNFRYVNYPQAVVITGPGDPTADRSRDIGATNLNQQIRSTPGTKVVVGYSQGASVNTRWLNWYKAGRFSDPPPPDELSFMNVGNPNRPNGGMAERFVGLYIPVVGITFDGATPSDTPYKVTEVAHEYSGFEDFPQQVLNVPADINALMGMLFVHAFYDQVDLNDPANVVTHDGNLTDVLVRTPVLPIMQPFYMTAHLLGRTETPVLDAISGPLRVIIDSAYDRSTAKATPADFGNPFKYLDTSALKTSMHQSVAMLLRGAPSETAPRTFTQFPDLSGIVKTLGKSPVDMSALNQATVVSAEKYLYGTPKVRTTPVAPRQAKPVLKLPVLPKLSSGSNKVARVPGTAVKPTAKPERKPGNGPKVTTQKPRSKTPGHTTTGGSSPKTKSGKSSGKSNGA